MIIFEGCRYIIVIHILQHLTCHFFIFIIVMFALFMFYFDIPIFILFISNCYNICWHICDYMIGAKRSDKIFLHQYILYISEIIYNVTWIHCRGLVYFLRSYLSGCLQIASVAVFVMHNKRLASLDVCCHTHVVVVRAINQIFSLYCYVTI